MPKPTLEEVGEEAGVSRATVSRVINDSPRVSPDAKRAVERAVAKLGYVPNRSARALVTRRTDTIALVVSEPQTLVFADPFFGAVVRGIDTALARTEMQLVMVMAQAEREHEKVARWVRQGHVDGVAMISLHGQDPLPRALVQAGIPTVLFGRPLAAAGVAYVDADNRRAGRAAVELLLSLGRRNIATIAGPSDMSAGADRFEGYEDAVLAAGLRVRPALVRQGNFGQESGYQAMRSILSKGSRVDGVFAANDLMAAGALRALHEAGRRVPDDVAIVGFDDAPLASQTEPPLTTMRQPLDEMSQALADLLLDQIAGVPKPRRRVICNATLIRRSSA